MPSFKPFLLPRLVTAFQEASPVNNVACDYTHLHAAASVMSGGIYVYAQLNANKKSCNLAFMLMPSNEDKAGHILMHNLNKAAGMCQDLLRCDGDKGMAGLPNLFWCAKHKFETFRRPRSVDGKKVKAYIVGGVIGGQHPGLILYLMACKVMTNAAKIYWREQLIERHVGSDQADAFRCVWRALCNYKRLPTHCKLYALHSKEFNDTLPRIDLVGPVAHNKTPLGEITNNTVEGPNNRLKLDGLKDMPPLDFLKGVLGVE